MENEKNSNAIATLFVSTTLILSISSMAISLSAYYIFNARVEALEQTVAELEAQKNPGVDISENVSKIFGTVALSDTDYSEEVYISVEDEQPMLNCDEPVPLCDTNTYRCMDYRTLTNHASEQWKLQMECYSDAITGIRVYTNGHARYYCAALGSAYGQNIGDAFNITLENGYSFNVVYGDFKNPLGSTDIFYGHPDVNYDGETAIGLVEFIYDKDIAPKSVINAGTMSALSQFGGLFGDGGNITSIKYIGKVWNT